MGKKKRRRPAGAGPAATAAAARTGGWQLNNWTIVAAIVFFFCAGILVKVLLDPAVGPRRPAAGPAAPQVSATDDNLEGNVQLVSANFRCACGQCGELPLIDCTCDSPRGAVEMKGFIREQLRRGLTVEAVIEQVAARYGHRIV